MTEELKNKMIEGCIRCIRGDSCPDHDDPTCPHCGTEQDWCDCCETWTCVGCSECGTCMCS